MNEKFTQLHRFPTDLSVRIDVLHEFSALPKTERQLRTFEHEDRAAFGNWQLVLDSDICTICRERMGINEPGMFTTSCQVRVKWADFNNIHFNNFKQLLL